MDIGSKIISVSLCVIKEERAIRRNVNLYILGKCVGMESSVKNNKDNASSDMSVDLERSVDILTNVDLFITKRKWLKWTFKKKRIMLNSRVSSRRTVNSLRDRFLL